MSRRLGSICSARELPDGPLDPPEPGEREPEPYVPPWEAIALAVLTIETSIDDLAADEDPSDRAREWRAEVCEGLADECDALAADLRETARRMRA